MTKTRAPFADGLLAALALLACAGTPVPSRAQGEPAVQDAPDAPAESRVVASLIDRAEDMMADANYRDALDELDTALGIDPQAVRARANRGTALALMDRGDEALAEFALADAVVPDFPQTLQGRGMLAGNQGRNEEALAIFERLVGLEPDNASFLFYRSNAYNSLDRPELALADVERTVALAPEWEPPYITRTLLLSQLGRSEEAIASAEDMVRRFSNNPDIGTLASELLMRIGETELADQVLDRALASGETAPALYSSAMRRDTGETDIKLRELTRALEIDPDFLPALLERSNTLWMEYRYREAMADADHALEVDPDLYEAQGLRAKILIDQNRITDAVRIAQGLVANHADDSRALANAIVIYYAANQRTRAREVEAMLRELEPDNYMIQAIDSSRR